MKTIYQSDETFAKTDYTHSPLPTGEYENCVFKNCNFSQSRLQECSFVECTFIECNLSMAQLQKTALRDVEFKGCKMLGLHFDDCNPFGFAVKFSGCQLDHSCFFKLKLKQTSFKDTQLTEVDFSECDLTNAVFNSCDLSGAVFENTILEKADFRTARNYAINPNTNRIKQARFSLFGLPGLLSNYDIVIDDL